MNILHLTPDFDYSDGRSYYVFLLMKYLKKRGHNVFLCSDKGDSFERLDETGIPYFEKASLSSKSSFVGSLKFISEIISTYNIEIIHSHHRYFELLSNSVKKKNIRTVFTALSIVDKRYYIEYRSDKIIAVSNCVRDMLINKFNVSSNRISVIPNFIESNIVFSKNKEKEKSMCILSVGRFHRDKNFETLLKAAVILNDLRIKFILIGEGPEMNKYIDLIKKHSLNAELISPQKDLTGFFKKADICVLPSVRDPLPGFMLQSGMFGKPFIGSNTDGISEVIENEVNGLLFEKKNELELSQKIRQFMNDGQLASKCAYNLNKLVKEKFTEISVIPQIEILYNS